MKRRSLLKSICLAPLAAVFGKLKPARKTWTNSRKEIIDCIEWNGTSDWVQLSVVNEGKGEFTVYVNGEATDVISYSKCLNGEEIKQIYEVGKSVSFG